MENLDGIVKRLEAATVRLEALSHQKPSLAPKPAATSGTANHVSEEIPSIVKQYDEQIEDLLLNFFTLCSKIGGQKEPDASQLPAKMEPIIKLNEEILRFKESKRNTQFFNHISAMAEGIPAVAWISVKPTPVPYIKEMLDASMFFVNRVRKDFKADQLHQDWVNAWCEIFSGLSKYVKQYHTTGLVWNSAPGATPPTSATAKPAPASKGGPAPPPPPPPPPAASKPASDSDRQALFSAINKGEAITSSLKKVTSEMQTHKNPGLRAGATVPANVAPAKGAPAPARAQQVVSKPPRLELENFKNWVVENYRDNKNIVVEINDMKQTVYVYKCENSVLQVKGKVNSVTIDSCKKTSVVFENLLSQVEIINCQSIEVQSLGALPTISIQKTDGCQVYLSKDSISAEIVTSKSSEMNVLVPSGPDGDFVEFPIPEQFKTVYNVGKKKLETTVSDIV
uniref:Adenylyl cyclase-associated protein n=1 Tax=Acrobeloides nanus TaxID=290746 RepID=A0A914C9I9_9BILA